MASAGKIIDVRPKYALPGAELEVVCEDFRPDPGMEFGCYVNELPCHITASSRSRVMAIVPPEFQQFETATVELGIGQDSDVSYSNPAEVKVAGMLADEMHIVANPAIDPSDDSIVVTRSGSRGQRLENTIYRIEPSGYVDELPDPI